MTPQEPNDPRPRFATRIARKFVVFDDEQEPRPEIVRDSSVPKPVQWRDSELGKPLQKWNRSFWTRVLLLSWPFLAMALIVMVRVPESYRHFKFMAFFAFGPALARFFRPRRSLPSLASADDLKLMEAGPNSEEVLVELWILQDAVVTGHDHGLLLIEQNAIVFDGRRSSFCLGAQDFDDPPRLATDDISDASRLYFTFDGRLITLALRAMKGTPDKNSAQTLRTLLATFSRAPSTLLERQFPPLSWDRTLSLPTDELTVLLSIAASVALLYGWMLKDLILGLVTPASILALNIFWKKNSATRQQPMRVFLATNTTTDKTSIASRPNDIDLAPPES